jgi:hypothetical protein
MKRPSSWMDDGSSGRSQGLLHLHPQKYTGAESKVASPKAFIYLMCHTPTLGNEDHDKMHMKVLYEFWFWFKKLVWDLDRISA